MRWLEITENSHRPTLISFDFDDGTIEGYSIFSYAEQLPNWLSKYDINDSNIIDNIRSSYQKIAMINNINVDEDSRGQGTGSDLLESFESEAASHGCQAILLVSDIHESQVEGFNLTDWYSRMGYQKIINSPSGPLMIKII